MSPDLDLGLGTQATIKQLERIVVALAFDAAEDDWSEVERTYENDDSYVSFSLCADADESDPCVRIEMGVQDESSRHPTAGLKAQWNREDGSIGQVQTVLVHGQECEPKLFLRRLEGALEQLGVPAVCV